jgi:hypothetical protein
MSENHDGEIDAVHDSPLYDMREGWYGMSRRTPKAQDLMEPHPMTEPFSPKYLGLLAWVLGIYLTRLAPARLENWATVVAVIGFVAWFGWVSQRTRREVRRQLAAPSPLKRGRGEANAATSPRLTAVRNDA